MAPVTKEAQHNRKGFVETSNLHGTKTIKGFHILVHINHHCNAFVLANNVH